MAPGLTETRTQRDLGEGAVAFGLEEVPHPPFLTHHFSGDVLSKQGFVKQVCRPQLHRLNGLLRRCGLAHPRRMSCSNFIEVRHGDGVFDHINQGLRLHEWCRHVVRLTVLRASMLRATYPGPQVASAAVRPSGKPASRYCSGV